ncbi:MAG: glycine oxidase ThiO [Candidatus Thiodiazotropha endolucinida]
MTECLIVGGGIIGMLTANELHTAGMAVALVEKGHPGRESSWAGGGIVSPLYPWRYDDSISKLAQWSQAHYPAITRMLIDAGGPDPEYLKSGLLILEPTDTDRATAWSGRFDQPLHLIDQEGIAQCEPGLDTEATEAIWLPEVAQIRNPRLTKSLYHAIRQKITIHEQTEATELLIEQGRLRGVMTPTGILEADRVIVCAGAWSGNLLSDIVTPPAIEPVLGQMIIFRHQPGMITRIVLHNDRYIIPRKDGRVLVGSTLEYRGFDKHTTEQAKQELKAFAHTHFPGLGKAEIEHHWAGLRPGSPSGIPYIGPIPEIGGLYLNAGHFRNGVVLGPASARLMADIVLEHTPILDPESYAIDAKR